MLNELVGPFGLSIIIGMAFFFIAAINANKFLDWLRWQSIGNRDYIVEKLDQMFLTYTPNQVLLAMVLTSVIPGFLVFLIILPQFVPALIFGFITMIGMWYVPKAFVNHMFNKRVTKFNVQMIDGLGLMANGMKSGLSIVQAMALVKNEMPDPMSQEFDHLLKQNQLGVTVEDCFLNLAKRVPSDDVNMFVTAIVILKETGGNLAETFETIVYTIRERVKVEQKISAMVAQGVAQGVIVFMMPFGLMAMFYMSDPEFMAPLFTSPIGWMLFGVILTLQLAGGFAILKIIQIKV